MRLERIGLGPRIFFLVAIIILISVGVETFFIRDRIQETLMEESGKRLLFIAQRMAGDPMVEAALALPDPTSVLQPMAEGIRRMTQTSFVVVLNMDAIRYSHPHPDRVGKAFVGGDEKRALAGETYVSQAKGTLGVSQRAFAPIYDFSGRQIGVVSVGILLTEVRKRQQEAVFTLYVMAFFGILMGLAGAVVLSRNIKKSIFGLEPYQIGALLEERNVIFSSIKEGVIAIDRDERIIFINESARRLLSIEGVAEGTRVSDAIPQTCLPDVVRTGEAVYDEEWISKGTILLVNRIPMRAKGEVIGAVATFRDMSEIRKLAEELVEVRQYTDALRREHHEHLNRLHVIAGLLQLRRYREAVRYIVSTVSRKQAMADFLRQRVRTPAVSGLLLSKLEQAQKAGIGMVISPDSVLAELTPAATGAVITILGNLIENAVEALAAAAIPDSRVEVSLREVDGSMVLQVRDNGGGFPADIRERIFEKGFTTKKTPKNMGMGLYLVRSAVERYRGICEVILDGGVTFRVTLPLEAIRKGEATHGPDPGDDRRG
ncbi:MAG: sensor histidine kinase [Deltaproteobacteria bacterium]|nr:sensor histidine kinase [Deltaproteobacteria bacterium]